MAQRAQTPVPVGVRFRFLIGSRIPEQWRAWAINEIETSQLWPLQRVCLLGLIALVASAPLLFHKSGDPSFPALMPLAVLPLSHAFRLLVDFPKAKRDAIAIIEGRRPDQEVPSPRFMLGLLVAMIATVLLLYIAFIR